MSSLQHCLKQQLGYDSTSITIEQKASACSNNISSECIESKRIRTEKGMEEENSTLLQDEVRKRKIAYEAHKNKNSSISTNGIHVDHTQLYGTNDNSIFESELDTSSHVTKSAILKLSEPKFNLQELFLNFDCENCLQSRCQSVLNLALCYLSEDIEVQLSECLACINLLSDSHNHASLAVCHALLLCAFTKTPLTLDEIRAIEDYVIRLADSRVITEGEICIKKPIGTYSVSVLLREYNHATQELCEKLFSRDDLDVKSIDVSTICCSALCNLSLCVKQLTREVAEEFTYGTNTLQYILGMTGKSTQGIVYENLIDLDENDIFISTSSYTAKQCLEVLEHALSLNAGVHCHFLEHEKFSLPHCLTRLLAWCISSLFPEKESERRLVAYNSSFDFYLSTLLSILKILSVLTFNPHQYDTFTNIKGLMEKIMICALRAYFELEENHFAILVLCLEMLINLFIKNQKTFILLCLKRFNICTTKEMLAVEALVKILSNSLNKIKEVKKIESSFGTTESSNTDENQESNEEKVKTDMQLALQAADKDMELSTIVSFVCVLLVFFMKTKQSFQEFIQKKLPLEMFEEAIVVCRKFLEFASLTGGMPQTGILILQLTIKKLQVMNASY